MSVDKTKELRQRLLNQFHTQAITFKKDIHNDSSKYLLPFEKGWKREITCRLSSLASPLIRCDIYYYSPSGKKFRSCNEIITHLKQLNDPELSVDNFTFISMFVDGNPNSEYETCRVAKRKSANPSNKKIWRVVRKCDGKMEKRFVSVKRSTTMIKRFIVNKSLLKNQKGNLECASKTLTSRKLRRKITFLNMKLKQQKNWNQCVSLTCSNDEEIQVSSTGRRRKLPKHFEDFKVDTAQRIPKLAKNITTIDLVADEACNENENSLQINVKNDYFDLSDLYDLNQLRSISILSLTKTEFLIVPDLSSLATLRSLVSLKLTHVKNLNTLNIEVLTNLTNLEQLHLGHCTNLSDTFGKQILIQLKKLKTLRLENGQGTCILDILRTVVQVPSIEQIELLNFIIPFDFSATLIACKNLKRLLLLPDYNNNPHYIFQWMLKSLFDMQQLQAFVFVITANLLELTRKFIEIHGQFISDCVPFLEPTPAICVNNNLPRSARVKSYLERTFIPSPLRVEFITVDRLRDLFYKTLPSSQTKITIVPDSDLYSVHMK